MNVKVGQVWRLNGGHSNHRHNPMCLERDEFYLIMCLYDKPTEERPNSGSVKMLSSNGKLECIYMSTLLNFCYLVYPENID